MVFDIYNPYSNQTVTRHYVDIIIKGIAKAGFEVESVSAIRRKAGNDSRGIVVVSPFDVIKARFSGYRYVLFWSQGLAAEESFMRNGSRARFLTIRILSKYALCSADLTFVVSDAMREYYQNNYGVTMRRVIVMPCFNEETGEADSVELKERRSNVFLYAGGIAPWQCFEETVELYRAIEKRVADASLLVLVQDREQARRILEAVGVARYDIDYVDQDRLRERIREASYGFCLRADDPVNNVATPTKLSTYVANDIIPICSRSLIDFCCVSEQCRAVIQVGSVPVSDVDVEKIVRFCQSPLSRDEIHRDFLACFGKYYSKSTYIDEIARQVKELVHSF